MSPVDGDRDLAERLRGVAVIQGAGAMTDLRHLLHRLDDAGLVVDGLHGHERGAVVDHVGQSIEVDATGRLDRRLKDRKAAPDEQGGVCSHGRVLDRADDDLVSVPMSLRRRDGHGVRLRAAPYEQHALRPRPERRRDLIARLLDQRARLTAEAMRARRVAERRGDQRSDTIAHGGSQEGGSVVVEVDHRSPSQPSTPESYHAVCWKSLVSRFQQNSDHAGSRSVRSRTMRPNGSSCSRILLPKATVRSSVPHSSKPRSCFPTSSSGSAFVE